MLGDYLTDSTSFRYYIAEYDDAVGSFSYQCQGDSLKITQSISDDGSSFRVVQSEYYSAQQLKDAHNLLKEPSDTIIGRFKR